MRRSSSAPVWRRVVKWVCRYWALCLGVPLLLAVLGGLLFGALPHDLGRVLLQYVAAPLVMLLAQLAAMQWRGGPPPPPVPAVAPPRRRTVAGKSRGRRE